MKPSLIQIPSSFTSTASTLLKRITRGTSPLELVYTPHDQWPLSRRSTTNAMPKDRLSISVLDSSFNPPTLAHLALGRAPAPDHIAQYDARLLLLSVRNADKALKPGDATYIQRLEMMFLLAQDIAGPEAGIETSTPEEEGSNVAIAIIDEPTFVGKSTALLTLLRSRLSSFASHPPAKPNLTFLLGLDTLERLFSTRYYPSEDSMLASLRNFLTEGGEGSRVVCARRDPTSYPNFRSGTEARALQKQEEVITPHVQDFILADRIKMIDIGSEEQTYSSSEVRKKRALGLGGGLGGGAPMEGDKEGERWKRLVSQRVSEYIQEKGLYLE